MIIKIRGGGALFFFLFLSGESRDASRFIEEEEKRTCAEGISDYTRIQPVVIMSNTKLKNFCLSDF